MSEDLYQELVDFLGHTKPELRRVAVHQIVGLAADDTARQELVRAEAPRKLARLIGDFPSIAKDALTALINLCEEPAAMKQMFRAKLVNAVMEALKETDCAQRRLCVMLLSNLAQTTEGCLQILQMEDAGGRLKGLHLRRLVQWFCSDPKGYGEDDEYEYVSLILQNITQLSDAREIILNRERPIFSALLKQLSSPSVIRRRGVAGAIRNCCFEVQNRLEYFCSPTLGLVQALGTPLAGPEPHKSADTEKMPREWLSVGGTIKKREPDAATRRLVIEALVLLAASKEMRAIMRSINLYAIVRTLHEWIEGEDLPQEQESKDSTANTQDMNELSALRRAARNTAEQNENREDLEELKADSSKGAQSDAGVQSIQRTTKEVQVPVEQLGRSATSNQSVEHSVDEDVAEDDLKDLCPDDEKSVYAINVLVQYLLREEGDEPTNKIRQVTVPKDGDTELAEKLAELGLTKDDMPDARTSSDSLSVAHWANKLPQGSRALAAIEEQEDLEKREEERQQSRLSTYAAAVPAVKGPTGFEDMD